MENTTSATILSLETQSTRKPATVALHIAGRLLLSCLKSMGAAWRDPMTCSAFWIGGSPAIWGVRK